MATRDVSVRAASTTVGTVDERETPIFNLKAKREQIIQKLVLDLRVPRWREEAGLDIWVRYAPVSSGKLEESVEKRQKAKTPDQNILIYSDVLVQSCICVYIKDEDHPGVELSAREGDPFGHPTKFDPDLGTALGMSDVLADRAVNVVRKLYLTDGDLVDAASQLMEWSVATNEKADTDFSQP